MKLEKAKKCLEILSLNREQIKSKNGLSINKFAILPIEYIDKNKLTVDWSKILSNRSDYQKTLNNKWDYRIVGIIIPQSSTVSIDYNSERFEQIAEEKLSI